MRASLRLKRTLATVATGALALSLLPGVAFADAIDFSDVCEGAADADFDDAGTTHAAAINCMNSYEGPDGLPIFRGNAAGDAAPFQDVTRGQFSALLVRFALVANPDLADTDISGETAFTDIEGTTFEDDIRIIEELNLVDGFDDNTFRPNETLNRGQAAKILYGAHVALGVDFDATYPEAFEDEGETFGEFIRALFAVEIVVGTTDTTFEPFTNVERGAAASLLARSAQVLADAGIWTATLVELEANLTYTDAPELVEVSKTAEADVVSFLFDETVTGQQLNDVADAGSPSLIRYTDLVLYAPDGTPSYPFEASINGDTVSARFDDGVVAGASRAGVRYDAVEDAQGVPNIEGDFPLQVEATPGAETNPYPAPLTTVRDYRLAPVLIGGQQRVLVDFVFDGEVADPTDADGHDFNDTGAAPGATNTDAEEFFLVGSNGAEFQGLAIYDVNVAGGVTTITVALADNPTDVPESQLRRGYVIAETGQNDNDSIVDEATEGVVLAGNFETENGNTIDPDLLTVERTDADTVRYVFDEAVSDSSLDESLFFVAQNDGTRVSATSVARSALAEDEAAVVIADFSGSALAESGTNAPVIGFVGDSAVTATDSLASENAGQNRPDQAALTLPAPEGPEEIPAGVTALPDLLSVDRTINSVTSNYTVAFEFDGDAEAVIGEIDFDLYDGNGTRFNVTGVACGDPGVTCTTTDGASTISFSIDGGFANYSNEQIAAAETGAVQDNTIAPFAMTPDLPVITEGQVGIS